MKTHIIPAILAKNEKDFEQKLRFVAGYSGIVQIDMMDGVFVKNKTFYNIKNIKAIRVPVTYELHMMIQYPEKVLDEWLKYTKVSRVIIHYEAFHKRKIEIYDILGRIKKARKEVGIAINPNTTISKVLEFLPTLDQLLVMGVQPGWSGQKFQDKVLGKIKEIRKHYPKLHIAVDGGVNEGNYKKIIDAGANILNSASMFLAYQEKPQDLKKLLKEIRLYKPKAQ